MRKAEAKYYSPSMLAWAKAFQPWSDSSFCMTDGQALQFLESSFRASRPLRLLKVAGGLAPAASPVQELCRSLCPQLERDRECQEGLDSLSALARFGRSAFDIQHGNEDMCDLSSWRAQAQLALHFS